MSAADAQDGPEPEEKLLQVAAMYALVAIAERLDKIAMRLEGVIEDDGTNLVVRCLTG